MNIKNLKVNKKKLGALLLSGTLLAFSLTGCTSTNNNSSSIVEQQIVTKRFEAGEHILSIPIGNPTNCTAQYFSHPGYKCVGIGTGAYGKYGSSFGGACLLFVNEYPVECQAILKNEEVVFNTFGNPIDYEEKKIIEDEESKVFYEGEHILSISISSPINEGKVYPSFEGYEPIGIAFSTYGQYFGYYSGGCILYANTVPVRCKKTFDKDGNPQYFTFGEVVSKTKVKE